MQRAPTLPQWRIIDHETGLLLCEMTFHELVGSAQFTDSQLHLINVNPLDSFTFNTPQGLIIIEPMKC